MMVSSMQAKRMWVRLAAVALAGVAASSATAQTTAWWHFDDKAPGQQTTNSTDWVVDSIYGVQAQPIMMKGGTDNQFESGTSAPRPAYVAPLATGVVYDPVTKVRRENVAAMNFSAQPGRDANGTKDLPAYYAAALRVGGAEANQAEATQPTDAITVECFVRTTATDKDFNGLAPIFAKRKGWDWPKESYALYMDGAGKMVARLKGAPYFYNDSNRQYCVNDGKWHHVALTYSASDAKVKVYVDYRLDMEKTIEGGGQIAYDESTATPNLHALWIGGTANYDKDKGRRTFPGDIDELRISDTALKPEEFLRLETPDEPAYRLTFDVPSANGYVDSTSKRTFLDTMRRVSDSLFLSAWLKCTDEKNKPGSALYDTAAKSADALRAGVFSNATANAAAVEFQPKTEGGRYVKVENFTKEFLGNQRSSFTAECFFKTRGQVDASQTIFQIGATPTMKVLFNADNSGRLFYCWNTNSWAGAAGTHTDTDRPDDGQWHHVAFVYDDVRKQIRCYLDYRRDYAVCATNALDLNASLMVGGGYSGGKFGQCFDGWIDDVRVTKAALLPEQFLCAHDVAVKAADPTRLFAAFDNNKETGPYPSFTGCWEDGPAGTGGKDAGFAGPRFAELLLGGADTTERTPNLASLQLNGSAVAFPSSRLYEQEAFTVEFFGKFKKIDLKANIIRYVSEDTLSSAPVWALYRNGHKNPTIQLSLALVKDGKSSQNYNFMRVIPDLEDNRWHHYALTFAPTPDGNTHVVLYRDYQRVFTDGDTEEVAGRLNFAAGERLVLNSAAGNDLQVAGRIDSLRFSKGVLPPERFIRRAKVGYVMVIW